MKISWRSELLQCLVIGAMFALAAWSWPQLPERIPIHWNLKGEIDGYGGKFVGLLLLPLTALGMYGLLWLLHFVKPQQTNYATYVTAFTAIRMIILLFLAAIYGAMVLAAFGRSVAISSVVCFGLAVMFGVMGNYMSKIRPNQVFGVRTPWTLSSKMSWNKTHRLAGWLYVMMGLGMVALGIVPTLGMLIVVAAITLACNAWIVLYSYLVYRRDPDRVQRPAGISPHHE